MESVSQEARTAGGAEACGPGEGGSRGRRGAAGRQRFERPAPRATRANERPAPRATRAKEDGGRRRSLVVAPAQEPLFHQQPCRAAGFFTVYSRAASQPLAVLIASESSSSNQPINRARRVLEKKNNPP